EFKPGGRLPSQPHARGTVESLTVISGQLQVQSGAASETLGPGDTARYAADVAHAITAPGEAARAFLIVKSE
ncbi:MAG: cupin domain-containing protein, partial [Pseudomonadota bacterium]|nr:cupin domain-containing protein [Pseudomonadota bacterium]